MVTNVKMSEFIDAVSFDVDEAFYVFDKVDDEIIYIDGIETYEADYDLDDRERYLYLPSSSNWDFNNYDIMCEFIESLPNGKEKSALASAIKGRGAFRRFNDTCINFGKIEDWYEFYENAIKEIVLAWAKDHDIEIRE